MATDSELRELCGKACDMLNRAWKGDPNAMYALSVNRVPCNQVLGDDPNVVVDQIPIVSDDPRWAVGMVGVVVGMFQAMGFPCTIAAQWSDETDADGRMKMTGFSVVEFSRCQPEQAGDGNAEAPGQ